MAALVVVHAVGVPKSIERPLLFSCSALISHQRYGRSARSFRRGPGPFIGGQSLGKGNDSSETDVVRGFERDSPSTAEKSLRSTIELGELYRTTLADLKTDVVVNVYRPEKVQQKSHPRTSARRWKKILSDRGLQVDDLKAAGTLLCLAVI